MSVFLDQTSKNTVHEILKKALREKDSYKVFVFGSRARGDHKKYSDLDLWIESSPGLNAMEIADLYQCFSDSDLAITVDIVTPETCLPEYKAQIESEKIFFE
ncbi:MAG: nucleotidyltransferase family protein [Pseudobdellovibrionaceae bacterium]|jgi:predicted nucleotidyltransferase